MALKLNCKHLEGFVSDDEIKAIQPEIDKAVGVVNARNGEGSDFLGWIDLPVDYDKEEFARIEKAAEKINDPVALAALYDEFVKFYKLTGDTQLWTAQAAKFLTAISQKGNVL